MTTKAIRSRFPIIGTQRAKFAWTPVRRYTTPDPFIAPEGWYWFEHTQQTRTGIEGWIAYADDNKGAKVYSDKAITTGMSLSLLLFFLGVSAAISPLVASSPLAR